MMCCHLSDRSWIVSFRSDNNFDAHWFSLKNVLHNDAFYNHQICNNRLLRGRVILERTNLVTEYIFIYLFDSKVHLVQEKGVTRGRGLS